MKIIWKTIQKFINPSNHALGKLWHPAIARQRKLTNRDIYEEMAVVSGLSVGDAGSNIETYWQVIIKRLMAGDRVPMGDYGTIALNLKTTGEPLEKDVTENNIIANKPIFTPSEMLLDILKRAKYEKQEKP